tara:strand:+ start:612 stop:737 length:126 start_codon:yes stop_codon:yes gene_type:complete
MTTFKQYLKNPSRVLTPLGEPTLEKPRVLIPAQKKVEKPTA